MLRAISEIAVAISVVSVPGKPEPSASARPSRAGRDEIGVGRDGDPDLIGIRRAPGEERVEELEGLVEVERRPERLEVEV